MARKTRNLFSSPPGGASINYGMDHFQSKNQLLNRSLRRVLRQKYFSEVFFFGFFHKIHLYGIYIVFLCKMMVFGTVKLCKKSVIFRFSVNRERRDTLRAL